MVAGPPGTEAGKGGVRGDDVGDRGGDAGAREPPLKISFPCAITHPNPGGGWKEGEKVIALYAYRLRGGHWRMDGCVQSRAGVPFINGR